MPDHPVIMWFRQDLRLADNRALRAAIASGKPIISLYIFDEVSAGRWRPGGASLWWLGRSLRALDQSLHALGNKLVLVEGQAPEVLERIAGAVGATEVYCSRDYEPWRIAVEKDVNARLSKSGASLNRYRGRLLFEPDGVATKEGAPYKVYTPFWRTVSKLEVAEALPAPETMASSDAGEKFDQASVWRRFENEPDWAGAFSAHWSPGEAGALARLKGFLDDGIGDYRDGRDRPDQALTSRLSPHLHFGEISPRQVWNAAGWKASEGFDEGVATFLREIVWREFSYNLLFHWPELPDTPLRPEFKNFQWEDDDAALQAWQKGLTGYPIVDAGMRELWQTGWMHNRVRMIVASFLIKDLLIPWQVGEAWFWDTLVDADLANNSANWQWVAGCGADAAPYFRVFNPVTQGRKFDPDGGYVRRYVPELAELGDDWIHAPWEASRAVLEEAGVRLGDTYPEPIVDHAIARQRALQRYESVKSGKAQA